MTHDLTMDIMLGFWLPRAPLFKGENDLESIPLSLVLIAFVMIFIPVARENPGKRQNRQSIREVQNLPSQVGLLFGV